MDGALQKPVFRYSRERIFFNFFNWGSNQYDAKLTRYALDALILATKQTFVHKQ